MTAVTATAVKATIIINFGTGIEQGAATAELADDLNGDKSQFAPGDPCFFRLFGPPEMVVDQIRTSAGDVLPEGVETVDREDTLTFADVSNPSADLSVQPSGPITYAWWGNHPVELAQDNRQIIVSEELLPLIGKATYQAMPMLYQLLPPPMTLLADEEYPIVIMIEVSIPGGNTP